MSAPRTGIRLTLTLAVCAALAACATPPPKPAPKPAVVTALPDVPTPSVPAAPAAANNEPWASIVASDVMHDCGDSPLIRANAAMYTRSPARFEQQLKQSLPLIIYVHKQLQEAGIPGEFAMLPMLESSYNTAEPSHRGDPAGMWQMMPRTARQHGIRVNREYDGRLDPVASTRAAIKMLTALHERFDDWRLADMAYNSGPYAVIGALRDHPDLGDQPIPDIPVSHTTRTHLARLMALSCIIRQPERFQVSLPKASPDDEVATIKIPTGTRLADAADMAEVSEAKLRALNPGYRGARVPADSARTLLLPADAAQSLSAALAMNSAEPIAQVTLPGPDANADDNPPLPNEPSPPPQDDVSAAAAPVTRIRHHRVRAGETLWSIAHDYHVSVSELKRWNDLHDSTLRAGEELRIHG